MATFDFRTGYNFRFAHPGFSCVGPSLTQQHFKDECDINVIIARHDTTGLWCKPGDLAKVRQPLFDDFSVVPDFMDAQNFLIEAGELFDALPSRVRKRFNNSPAELLEFLNDPANAAEAVALGLVSAPAPSPAPSEPVVEPAPPIKAAE